MTAGGMRMDVDPKLQTNRVSDLGRTVRPSTRYAVAAVAAALAVLAVFALICSMAGHGFDILALFYILSRQWGFSHGQWVLAGLLIVSAMMLGGPFRWLLVRKVAPRVAGGAHRTRVDVYAPAMGHGDAVAKVTRARAETMAPRLVRDYDAKAMEPGYPLGRNIVDGTPMSTSWEDMAIVVAGPRSGKSLCYAIPAVCSAPGPCLATSNKGDILDVTRPVRMHDHPDGRIWVFDPERIAEPNRTRTTWVWNLIDSIRTIADAKRIADCWRYASGQPSTGGDDFFPGTAAQQLADYLFAAHLGGRTVADVFRWASSERNTEPVTILSQHEGYGEIASRVSSVIALTPETRSGVFGSLQTMVAFLADPDVIEWILPREGDGTPEGRAVFDPLAFAASEGDTLYLLSAQGRPSTALTASLTAVVAFTAFHYAQSECVDNDRRLPRPMCCVLDEAANICRWPELADVYSYFGSAGIPIMTIWQNPDQGKAAFGETNFGSLFNNANILVYLGGIKDAKWLGEISSLVGQREIVRGSLNVDGRGRRSVNNSIQRENILDVSDLAEWPVGRALVLASQCRAQIDRTMPWTERRVWADLVARAGRQGRRTRAMRHGTQNAHRKDSNAVPDTITEQSRRRQGIPPGPPGNRPGGHRPARDADRRARDRHGGEHAGGSGPARRKARAGGVRTGAGECPVRAGCGSDGTRQSGHAGHGRRRPCRGRDQVRSDHPVPALAALLQGRPDRRTVRHRLRRGSGLGRRGTRATRGDARRRIPR